MATIALSRFLHAAKDAGCKKEQLRNFRARGYAPHRGQLLFHAAAREADNPGSHDEIGYGGARGPGKSHGIFAQMALDDCQRRAGLKCLYLRKVLKKAREQLDDLRRSVLFAIPHKYNRVEGLIVFQNQSRVIMGHFSSESDIDAYLGFEYDVIAVEETTTLTSNKYQALSDSNRTSRDDWRPRIYNSTNPGGVGHAWYKKKFIDPARKGIEKYTKFIFGTVEDNPYIDPDYKRKLEGNTGWRLRAYRYGDWDIAAGQFFTTFRYDTHVIQPFDVSKYDDVWLSFDYGYHHWTECQLHVRDGDGNIYTVDEYSARQRPIETNAEGIHNMVKRNGFDYQQHVRMCAAGTDVFAKRDSGPTIAEKYARKGIHMTAAKTDRINGAAQMLDLLGDIDRDIRPRWYIFNRCNRLIDTLPIMEHDPRRPDDVLKVNTDEDGNGGDDPYDCARYGVMEAVKQWTIF